MKFESVKAKSTGNPPTLIEVLRVFFQSYLITGFVIVSFFSFFTISTGIGTSMGSTFGHGELELSVNTGKTYSPLRGDIVNFVPPLVECFMNGELSQFEKRVIGLPGDLVEIQDNRTYINGVELTEPYAEWAPYTLPEDDPYAGIHCDFPDVVYENGKNNCVVGCAPSVRLSWTVPAGNVFVMGDGRYACVDSRAFGFVPVDSIQSVVLLQFWPLNNIRLLRNQSY